MTPEEKDQWTCERLNRVINDPVGLHELATELHHGFLAALDGPKVGYEQIVAALEHVRDEMDEHVQTGLPSLDAFLNSPERVARGKQELTNCIAVIKTVLELKGVIVATLKKHGLVVKKGSYLEEKE